VKIPKAGKGSIKTTVQHVRSSQWKEGARVKKEGSKRREDPLSSLFFSGTDFDRE